MLVAAATAVPLLQIASRPAAVHADSTPEARGAELFATKGCAHCHGDNGIGGGKGPDLQLVRKRKSADELTRQIHDGGQEMPAYGSDLTATEISDLVHYLRAKRKHIVAVPAHKPPATTPAAKPKNPDDDSGF